MSALTRLHRWDILFGLAVLAAVLASVFVTTALMAQPDSLALFPVPEQVGEVVAQVVGG